MRDALIIIGAGFFTVAVLTAAMVVCAAGHAIQRHRTDRQRQQ